MYMKVLSLFDGISCFRVALGNTPGVEYLASEIDKNAIKIAKKNYPGTVHLGDVKDISGDKLPSGIDILVGGSPCTDLSIAMKGRTGLEGDRSKLFFEYLRILHQAKPKWFILENVASMSDKDRDIITQSLGVQPVMINAALVSAQNRRRYFWTNIPIKGLPADRGLKVADILESNVDEKYTVKSKYTEKKVANRNNVKQVGHVSNGNRQANRVYDPSGKSAPLMTKCAGLIQVGHISNTNSQANRVYDVEGKSATLTALSGGSGGKTGLYKIKLTSVGNVSDKTSQGYIVYDAEGKSAALTARGGGIGTFTGLYKTETVIRKLTPVECERLMGLPDNYTDGVSMTARYKAIGNAFHVEIMKWIISHIPQEIVPM